MDSSPDDFILVLQIPRLCTNNNLYYFFFFFFCEIDPIVKIAQDILTPLPSDSTKFDISPSDHAKNNLKLYTLKYQRVNFYAMEKMT